VKTSRRKFLTVTGGALAGSPFGTLAAERAPSADRGTARPGNPLIIDCQSHLFCPELVALMEKRRSDPRVFTKDGVRYVQMGEWLRKIPPEYLEVGPKLAAMDGGGIGMTALSMNDPGPEWFGGDSAAVARLANDFIAGIAQEHPGRFFGLCVLPLLEQRAAEAELERCVRQLKMKGILLYTNLAGHFPDEPQFHWLFARAAELQLPVLLHPAKPVTTEFVKGYEMISALGNMFDNTIALTRIIMSGLLDQYPQLKLVCPHLGGTLPYIIGRLDHQTQVLKRGPKYLTRAPSGYLRQVWLDIVSPLPLAMRFGYDFMGADRLLFASDHPWVSPELILRAFRSLHLPPEDEGRIFSENARSLFGLGG
jgi:predicted TIM-barrel fold metal-dependent hydrolase